jgi:acid phosphatase class B
MTKVIVVDLDGTLANLDHRISWISLKPKNWKAFNAAIIDDALYEDIKWLVDTLRVSGNKIIICTGRSSDTHGVTTEWLKNHNIEYNDIFMRRSGDHRPDYVVKVELLNEIREKHGEPYIWLDDRDQVVNSLRENGVRVLQVKEGNY